MFLSEFNRMGGEPPHKNPPPSRHSKGYPETPMETPRGILKDDLGEVSLRKLRQYYGAAVPRL